MAATLRHLMIVDEFIASEDHRERRRELYGRQIIEVIATAVDHDRTFRNLLVTMATRLDRSVASSHSHCPQHALGPKADQGQQRQSVD